MKVKMIETTTASGERVEEGQEYELSDRDARYLIALKKAMPVVEVGEEEFSDIAEGKQKDKSAKEGNKRIFGKLFSNDTEE